jgi:hypothetical protein
LSSALSPADASHPADGFGDQRVAASFAVDSTSEHFGHLLLCSVVVLSEVQQLAFVVGHEQFVIKLSAVSVQLLFGQSGGSGLQRQCDGGLDQWPAFAIVAFGHGL